MDSLIYSDVLLGGVVVLPTAGGQHAYVNDAVLPLVIILLNCSAIEMRDCGSCCSFHLLGCWFG